NISTAAAIVVAAAGARVAKHGNRAVSSRSGSADVLEAVGVRIDLPFEQYGRAIREIGIGFLFAQDAHTATRHAAPARKQMGVARAPLESIRGGTAAENAALIRRVLEGEAGPARDIVVVNAAAALVAADGAANFREAAGLASFVISSGAASEKLASLAEFTSGS